MSDNFVIRKFRAEDREAVRKICCDTGFLGNPIDPVFQDRELFADFLCAYYTDAEPESCIILEDEGEVRGYIFGCRFPDKQKSFYLRFFPPRFVKMLWRYLFSYSAATRRYVRWLLARGRKETPFTPKGMAHFHINLLPPNRNVAQTRALIDYFLKYLVEAGEKKVFGQMVTFHNRRGERMFARYGFEVVDSKEVSKYKAYVDYPVFLYTVVKDLEKNSQLYGGDEWEKKKAE